ncbi:MAG TPA: hypothetical protein VFD38_02995 [Myxococcaceae bacterium]|nr:hypothetical protein [Myxococcaceae bacterium]
MSKKSLELFHRLDEPRSARVRRWVVDHGLLEAVRFRNVVYPEAAADFAARGGAETPALWDGEQLFIGAELIIARLEAVLDVGRS